MCCNEFQTGKMFHMSEKPEKPLSESFSGVKKWSELDENQKGQVSQRYANLIHQRASNAYSWGLLFVKTAILANGSGLIATFAFASDSSNNITLVDYSGVIMGFGYGLVASIALLLLATIKTYYNLVDEVVFYKEMVTNEVDLSLIGKPKKICPGYSVSPIIIIAIVLAFASVGNFCFALYMGSDNLEIIAKHNKDNKLTTKKSGQ